VTRYTVILEWEDSEDKEWCDADEIVAHAKSAAGAASRARARWIRTNGAKWPRCKLTRVWVMTPKKRRELIGA
jgi:hypothetical protein